MKTDLKQLSKQQLSLFMETLGQRPYRTNQIINWIYRKQAVSFDDMSDLPGGLRDELARTASLSNLRLARKRTSKDGTLKFLFTLNDGESIESVLIPNRKGGDSSTLCISSQVGCAMRCSFCMTGRMGLKRNLKAFEIIDQVIAAERFLSHNPLISRPLAPAAVKDTHHTSQKSGITNIVFMGMGEPLNNFNEVSDALSRLIDCMGFSRRRITVSTSGIVPGIQKLASNTLRVNLAVSLNATTDETRSSIMPVNKKYPLKKLIKACRDFPLSPNRRITFEYVMIKGINDSVHDAHRLVSLLRGIKSKINLIPFNSLHDDTPLRPPAEGTVLAFQDVLRKCGLTAIIRKSMGADISAACGQLKASCQL